MENAGKLEQEVGLYRSAVVSVDPGKEFGAALHHGGKLCSSMHGSIDDAEDLSRFANLMDWAVRRSDAGVVLVVERGGWRGQMNACQVCYNAGMLIGWARPGQFWTKVWVNPSTWKKSVLGNGRATKEESCVFTGKTDHNESDAICIGVWATRGLREDKKNGTKITKRV